MAINKNDANKLALAVLHMTNVDRMRLCTNLLAMCASRNTITDSERAYVERQLNLIVHDLRILEVAGGEIDDSN